MKAHEALNQTKEKHREQLPRNNIEERREGELQRWLPLRYLFLRVPKVPLRLHKQEELKAKKENKEMTKTAAIYFATMLLPVAAIAAPGNGVCSTGTLLDVQVHVEMIQSGTMEHGRERVKKNGKREYDSYSTNYQQKQTTYIVTVGFDDMVYTAQSENFFGFGFKPTSFVVNDPIHGCVQGSTLALARPDGKEYKARILRAARVPDKPRN